MHAIRFIPHSVRLDTAAAVVSWINQVESTGPDGGITLFEESTGSATDREFVAVKDASPTIGIETSDLAILSTIGFSGLPFASDADSPGVVVYGRELPLEAVPTAVATTAHLKCAISDGLLVPVSLRASHGAVAKLSLMLHAILGTDATSGATPLVYTANTAIVAGAGQTANIFTVGPFKYTISGGASRLVQGVRDTNVNFGISVFKEGSDGEVYPSHISIIARMATVEFTTSDVELIAEIGDGISVSAAAAYFRRCTANGQRVAAATATHAAISGTAGMITPGAVNLAHKTPGTAAFTYTPVLNTNLISISTTSAIPTT